MFEVTTEYDKKALLTMIRIGNKTFRRRRFLIRRISLVGVGLVCLVSGGLLLMVFPELDTTDRALAVGSTLIGVLAAGEGIFLNRLSLRASRKAMIEGSHCWTLQFGEEGLSGKNAEGVESAYPYSKIQAVFETQEYFLMQIDKLHCIIIILDKNGFTQGTSQEFRRFIAEKTGLELRFVKI